jgi:hypothetical protein
MREITEINRHCAHRSALLRAASSMPTALVWQCQACSDQRECIPIRHESRWYASSGNALLSLAIHFSYAGMLMHRSLCGHRKKEHTGPESNFACTNRSCPCPSAQNIL